MAKPTLTVRTAPVDCTVHRGSPYSPLQWTVRSDAGDYSM